MQGWQIIQQSDAGAWASAAAKLAASNAAGTDMFQSTVKMWVYPEEVDGKRLDEIVNEKHENVKYLPGIKLPENLVASADLEVGGRQTVITMSAGLRSWLLELEPQKLLLGCRSSGW